MKKVSLISALMCSLFLVFAFNKNTSSFQQVETISLDKAIKDKIITASFTSNGSYSGKSIFCQVSNLTGKSYKISIPAGSFFQAPSSDEQDLIVPQEEFLALNANAQKSTLLNGFCTNLSNHAPKKEGKFKLITTKAPKEMPKLLAFLKGKKYENHTLQDAIWALTNKSSVTNINGEDEKSIAALRKELFTITGQKEDWYQSPQETTMNEDRSINRETASISGELSYQTKKGAKIHTEVLSPDGEIKIKTEDRDSKMSGELSFYFKVEVKGWKKGKYTVKVIEDSKVIKAYDFNV